MRKFFSPLVRKGSERRTPRRRGSSTSAASVGAPQLRPHSTGPDHIYTAFAEQGSEAGGTLRREIDDARSRLQSLPELSFRVVKVNHMGRRQRRILRLRGTMVENVRPRRNGGELTSREEPLDSIVGAVLLDHETVVIRFLESRDLKYKSPVATQIVSDIAKRLQALQSVNKQDLTFEQALRFQRQLEEEEEVVGSQRITAPGVSGAALAASRSFSSRRVTSLPGSSMPRASLDAASTRQTRMGHRAAKLHSLTGVSEEERLRQHVKGLLFNPATAEGRTCARFLSSFRDAERRPDTVGTIVRQFLDGLAAHTVRTRAAELASLLVDLHIRLYGRPLQDLPPPRPTRSERPEPAPVVSEETINPLAAAMAETQSSADAVHTPPSSSPPPFRARGAVQLSDGGRRARSTAALGTVEASPNPQRSSRELRGRGGADNGGSHRSRSPQEGLGRMGGGADSDGTDDSEEEEEEGEGEWGRARRGSRVRSSTAGASKWKGPAVEAEDTAAVGEASTEVGHGAAVRSRPVRRRTMAAARSMGPAVTYGFASPEEEEECKRNTLLLLVREEVEEAVVGPLVKRIQTCLIRTLPHAEVAKLRRVCLALKGQSQKVFDVPRRVHSPSAWAAACREMAQVGVARIPSRKLDALLAAMRAIYTTYKFEHSKGYSVTLGADDFLPICIFVIVHAELNNPWLEKDIMWTLCDSASLRGEGGYYLTVFDSALHYLLSIDPSPYEHDRSHLRAGSLSRLWQAASTQRFRSRSIGFAVSPSP